MGIKRKFWRILKGYYVNTKCKIHLNGNFTDTFGTSLRVKQGGVLSPLLFNIIFNELITEIKELGLGIKWNKTQVHTLLYADDIVVLAYNIKKLQKILNVVTNFGYKWRCTSNGQKIAIGTQWKETNTPGTKGSTEWDGT